MVAAKTNVGLVWQVGLIKLDHAVLFGIRGGI